MLVTLKPDMMAFPRKRRLRRSRVCHPLTHHVLLPSVPVMPQIHCELLRYHQWMAKARGASGIPPEWDRLTETVAGVLEQMETTQREVLDNMVSGIPHEGLPGHPHPLYCPPPPPAQNHQERPCTDTNSQRGRGNTPLRSCRASAGAQVGAGGSGMAAREQNARTCSSHRGSGLGEGADAV